ncbi:GlcNAc-domain-containing protein [Chytriomyces sp. MP71]|nr:GlcNAc-domain-containing protein [Chytriomyces sp. MP71]
MDGPDKPVSVSQLPSAIQLQILRMLSATSSPPLKACESVPTESSACEASLQLTALHQFKQNGFATVDHFLSRRTAAAALVSAKAAQKRPARIGPTAIALADASVRSDEIAFVSLDAIADGFREEMAAVMRSINKAFGVTLKTKESVQVAHYKDGSFYREHSDSSPLLPGRIVTAILYLTEDWQQGQGGELRIHATAKASTESDFTDIAPLFNRLLIFKSHIPHEVLPTHCDRYAITMWLYSEDSVTIEKLFSTALVPVESVGCSTTTDEACDTVPPISGGKQQKPNRDTMFVSIASYRDQDTHATVASLLLNAKYPERIKIGIYYQDHPTEDTGLHDSTPLPASENILTKRVSSLDATGPYSARLAIVNDIYSTLPTPPDFYLQIDSHMRLMEDWDETLLQLHAESCIISPRTVLSFYPPGFTDEHIHSTTGVFSPPPAPYGPVIMRFTGLDEDGMPRIVGALTFPPPPPLTHAHGPKETDVLLVQRGVAAGLLFAPHAAVRDALFPARTCELPGLFFGEEALLGARLFTHGWDVFAPRDEALAVAFHRWGRAYRPTFWENEGVRERKRASVGLVRQGLGLSAAGEDSACGQEGVEKMGVGLGSVRGLDAWKEFVGLLL